MAENFLPSLSRYEDRVLSEKPVVAQPVKKFVKVHYRFHKSIPLNPILSQITSIQSCHFIKEIL
jgi:hypothetical protein